MMKKFLLLFVIMLVVVSCKKEEQKAPEIPTPKYVATWYGHTINRALLPEPILEGNEYYFYHGPYVFECTDSLKKEGTLTLGTPLVSLKFKYKDNGEYLSFTDEFDRPRDLKIKIEAVNDTMCKMRINEGGEDILVFCSKNAEDRRKKVEEFYGKDANESKLSKEIYK